MSVIEILTEMMLFNKAVWHPNCRDLHNKQKVARSEADHLKRLASDDPNPSPVKTRSSLLDGHTTAECETYDVDDDSELPCLICKECVNVLQL